VVRRFVLTFLFLSLSAIAQGTPQYRAFWADTFNSSLNSAEDVARLVRQAKAAQSNAIFAQVRRRGDAWYVNSLEARPDFVPLAANFDPLAALIAEAHANSIEVHAFVILGAIWNKNPNFAPTASLGPPLDPRHVFNLHGGYDAQSQRIVPGPENWLTRTLLPDGADGISFQGHRIGAEFWLDFGHPAAAAHTVEVLLHLVRNYDVDGLHLDRVRYPELSTAGQSPAAGVNIGYNPTSVERFQRLRGIPSGSPPPSPGEPAWSQWRRDQVTQLVRRIYLSALAVKPKLTVSAALICFGDAPATEAAWLNSDAYWRVFQDWRSWSEEGIVDLAIPMNYKREHVAAQSRWTENWNEWTKTHQYRRASLIGLGVYLNSIEGSLRQLRHALRPAANGVSVNGASVLGAVFYALANPDTAVAANPLSLPPGQDTPVRGIDEFASALSRMHFAYENTSLYPSPVYAEAAAVPKLPWKEQPTQGHLMGVARGGDGRALDGATVTLFLAGSTRQRRAVTDGNGFYGFVDLEPGYYFALCQQGEETLFAAPIRIEAGRVAEANLGAPGER
jgi:uncharacterized lipoprotein YddW (UPF0748 family)